MGATICVTADEQLEIMEIEACATGITDYDHIRELMSNALRAQFGKTASLDYEEIPAGKLSVFIQWLSEED